jgi:hypothetical protein
MKPFVRDGEMYLEFEQFKMSEFKSTKTPYEGHFLHFDTKIEPIQIVEQFQPMLKTGDVIIPTNQRNRRFILSVLEPEMEDSYFAWNFFDSYVQQKEYFSSYVFEDKAAELLADNLELKKAFEEKKVSDRDFRESAYAQLYFVYKNSEFYEPTHNLLPLFRIVM